MSELINEAARWKRRAQLFEVLLVTVSLCLIGAIYFVRRYSVGTCAQVATDGACRDTFIPTPLLNDVTCPRDDQRIEAVAERGFFCRCWRSK